MRVRRPKLLRLAEPRSSGMVEGRAEPPWDSPLPDPNNWLYSPNSPLAALSVIKYASFKNYLYSARSPRAFQSAHLRARTRAFFGGALAGAQSRAVCHLVRQTPLEKRN